VAVAEHGRQVYAGIVLRKTPTGLLKVVHESDAKTPGALASAAVFYGLPLRWRSAGWLRGSTFVRRYLVPAESEP